MNGKGKVLAELGDEKWPGNFALLCVTSHRLNDLNTKLHGQEKLIYDMSGAVRAFEMKMKLF
jgi:hypothetical protein